MISLNKYLLQSIKLMGILLLILSYDFYTEGDGLIFLVFMIGSVILYAMIPLIERREVRE